MKHFILTRFLCDNFRGCPDEALFVPSRLDDMLDKLQYRLVASLENQTSKDFELVLMIHNNIDDALINKVLSRLNTTLRVKVVRKENLNPYIDEVTFPGEMIITTRIDGDDLVYSGFVADVQSYVCGGREYGLWGLCGGATIMNDENVCYYWPERSCCKSKTGYHSIGVTFYYLKKSGVKITNVYDLGNHRFVVSELENRYKELGFRTTPDVFFDPVNDKSVKCLYVGYGNNDSLKTGKRWHYTNKVVHMDLLKEFNYKKWQS